MVAMRFHVQTKRLRDVMSPSSQAEASRRIKEAPADFRVPQNRSIGCHGIDDEEKEREREMENAFSSFQKDG